MSAWRSESRSGDAEKGSGVFSGHNATRHHVIHELRHFNLWRQFSDKAAYWRLNKAVREQYVFDFFKNGPLWNRLSSTQQANEYRSLLRAGGNPLT